MDKRSSFPVTIELRQAKQPFEWSISARSLFPNAVHLIGFEFDGTACFRKGARLGPDALRLISDGIESYSPYLDEDLEDCHFYDLGNLNVPPYQKEADIEYIKHQWQSATDDFFAMVKDVDLKTQNIKFLTLGGEHSISFAPISACLNAYPDMVLLHLDAHADLRDGYLGYHYSHAAIIRRVLDNFGPGHELIQYGIRSGTKEEFDWMHSNGTIKTARDAFLAQVAAIPDDRPVYLTLDLDYFDPCYLPGTGTPEPGGEDFHSFISLCKLLKQKNFIGCDVVELAPNIDTTGNSDVLAAKVVRELIICLN